MLAKSADDPGRHRRAESASSSSSEDSAIWPLELSSDGGHALVTDLGRGRCQIVQPANSAKIVWAEVWSVQQGEAAYIYPTARLHSLTDTEILVRSERMGLPRSWNASPMPAGIRADGSVPPEGSARSPRAKASTPRRPNLGRVPRRSTASANSSAPAWVSDYGLDVDTSHLVRVGVRHSVRAGPPALSTILRGDAGITRCRPVSAAEAITRR